MTGQPVETQAQFDARMAAGRAFRASREGRQLAADGARILDALEAAYQGGGHVDQLDDDVQPGPVEDPADGVTGPADALDDGMAPEEKPWTGQPLRVDVPPDQLQPVTDRPGPVERVGETAAAAAAAGLGAHPDPADVSPEDTRG